MTARHRTLRIAMVTLALAALVGVFALYLRPDLVFAFANQVWACF